MTDSRWSAIRHYRRKAFRTLFNTSTFLGNVTLAAILTYFLHIPDSTPEMEYVLFLVILAIGLWFTEAIPPFATAIFIIAYLVVVLGSDFFLDEALDVEHYVGTWTSDVIWLLLGGFFLAEGMKQVALDRELFRFTVRRFGSDPNRLLLGLMLMTAVGSMIISNSAITAMMITGIMPLIRVLGKKSPLTKSILIGIPSAAAMGGMGTIISSPPNAITVGALEGIGIRISFLTWMSFGVPLAAILVVSFWKYLSDRLPKDLTLPDISFLDDEEEKPSPQDRSNRRVVLVTLALTTLLWTTEIIHNIPLAAVSMVPIVLLTLTGILSAEEMRALPWDTLMLVAGGLALGYAISDVELTEVFVGFTSSWDIPLWMTAILFGYFALLIGNVMSNTATVAILMPVAVGFSGTYGVAVALMLGLSASSALFLPVSTPPNAIAYSTRMLDQKDFRIPGAYFAILSPVLIFPFSLLLGYVFG